MTLATSSPSLSSSRDGNVRKVIAVVVTYNPDMGLLMRLVGSVSPQVHSIAIVDNGSEAGLVDWARVATFKNTHVMPLNDNLGVASAQNTGINWARSQGAEQVLLFDHDSNPPADMVVKLQGAMADLERTYGKVAAVGPRHIDSRKNFQNEKSPFIRLAMGNARRQLPVNGESYVPVDLLISSGSLISVPALDVVGTMQEPLFIEFVDVEWGMRANQAGWKLFGVWNVVMDHFLGDTPIRVLGRYYSTHTPLRHYYLLRNAVWLCRQSWMTWGWRLAITFNTATKFVFYTLFAGNSLAHFRFMCRGIYDGIRGRMGRFTAQ